MDSLRCPNCGLRGSARDESLFEVRGQHPHGHMPLRRCSSCGVWLAVRPRGWLVPGLGFVGRQLDPEEQAKLEHIWSRFAGEAAKVFKCPRCARKFATEGQLSDHIAGKHADAGSR